MPYEIPESDEDLLRACRVDVFRGTGHGGQSVNTTDSAVRLTHEESGIVVVARRERSQLMNKKVALRQLRHELEAANYIPPTRKATKPSHASVERRLSDKHHQSEKKRERSQHFDD